MSISPPPKNVLGFVVKTKKSYRGGGGIKPVKKETKWICDLSKDATSTIAQPTLEEIAWSAQQQESDYQTDGQNLFDPNSPDWLTAELGEDIFCSWCANTLMMNYSTARDGWRVHCSYCGGSGPVERDPSEAVIGYVSFVRI